MKSYFFKLTLVLICSFMAVPVVNYAQDNFQAKAYYQSKTTVDMSSWGNGQMSEERKKQIAERMKGMLEKTFVLTFNKTASLYKEEEKLDAPGGRGGWRMGSFTGGAQYKDVKEKRILQEQEFFGKQFLIKDELQQLDWVMGNETKQIGKYTAFKATAVKKTNELDWTNMRRRRKNTADKKKEEAKVDSTKTVKVTEDIEMPKEITVTAWYTPQIPINQGPGEYWGLPGLILEVQSGRTTILCSKIVMNPKEKKEMKVPSKGKEVTQKEYNATVKKKMQEMREMYGGRNRGNRVRIRS